MIQRLIIKVTDTIFIKDFQLIFFSVYKQGRFEIYPRGKEAVDQDQKILQRHFHPVPD